ncbi:type I-F CRISPR-associated protein Csy1 [Pseudomonas lopnurensis]|uniref:type I-F CRISPR-associated protein Csy1 n=1 Tax=Pseudomonas lopnurensis TaxID=1477517 RepID=UPI0028A822BB|nr:type I-F CRISPR-associated protein Csy1 [Pseudomonas lopnurensis]
MKEEAERVTRSVAFRHAIATFIDERREAKLKGADDERTAAKYDYTTWLADAARRVGQIQAVTHILKATHPDARGSNLYVPPTELPQHADIGTHSLGGQYAEDIVGNAAALDVYKFLKLEMDGQRLLDWLQQDDPDLLAALHDDPVIAREWADAFNNLIRNQKAFASHPMAKQVYWCVSGEPINDAGFHLLQPLFSSSLAHAVHQDIQDARFGEANKAARQARRAGEPHEAAYRDYRGLVARKLGGTKPQNISQLNSERGGVNYLLASLPPAWNQDRPRQLLFIDSVMPRFWRHEGVSELVQALCRLLESDPKRTMETRIHREQIEQALGQSLAAFGLEMRQLFEPGWTRDDNCRLPLCEQIWLDPERADLPMSDEHRDDDLAFIEAYEWKDWSDEVAHRFGNWLNGILQERGLPVGDLEHAHWAKQAIIDAEWPAPMQRRALKPGQGGPAHG